MEKSLLSKNLHQWLLLLVCFVATLPSWAEDYTEDGIIYDINTSTNTATVKGLEDKSATSAEIRNSVAGCEVTSLGWGAFSGCCALTSINIPSTVNSIEGYAFGGCSALTSLNIPSSVTSIGSGAFYVCSALTSINIPSSVTSIGEMAFYGCSSLTSINIPSLVTSIEDYVFADCSSLTSINIPSSVTSIESAAFLGCSSLTSINIPSSVTSIGERAFNDCTALTAINLPSSVTSIEWSAFKGCSSLTSINIPSSVTSIGWYAFSGCSALTSINIPSSVKSIGEAAFGGCDALKIVLIQSDRIEFGGGVFGSNTNIYAVSDNNLGFHLLSYYDPNQYPYVNNYIGGTWYTYDTPNIYDRNGSAISSDKWSGNKLDYNSGQYLKTILETSTNAQTFISNNNAIYNELSEDIRKNLEDNLKKIDDLANIIAAGDAALSDLSTNLSNAYNDVRNAVTGIEHATITPAATLRVYDLNGRRINVNHVDELPQGIYVINGKKVIR